ncbi:F0F1 ATP synthase subunit alpha [Oceanisphaera sp. W20_SRM_FM3]|uniref:F0F1 ATP synthase subunit alpha n=1 Tax=Oceanisphaera sp. W20_SRM_FM3 TaxID=3240267 RepID=UPI003F9B3A8E
MNNSSINNLADSLPSHVSSNLFSEDQDTQFEHWLAGLAQVPTPEPVLTEVGKVSEVADGIAIVSGLARALADELLVFDCGVLGIVLDLEPDRLGVILLGPSEKIRLDEPVRRTRKVVSVPVGRALLGRVVDAMGRPKDNLGTIACSVTQPIEAPAPGILNRSAIARPLATGITAIDAAIPVGLGQRQLIIGDRQTGKTSLAVDAILNQANTEVVCIYCAIGQRGDAVARVIRAIEQGNMLARCVIMAAGDEEAPGLAYIAPYAAMTMAEHFCAQGTDVLLIFDDMTHHARAYRELSLLLKRPPGREAFPGDIFYVHARLLERAGQFIKETGGGSITALPVVETQAENLSAYIPTNLISITDGQIYLSPRLVRKNQFPAVDLGLSVSRVGGKAQGPALRAVAGNLRVTLSQFEELEDFARFGTRLDDATKARLTRGVAVRNALRQAERKPQSVLEQLAVLIAAMAGVFDALSETATSQAIQALRLAVAHALPEIVQHLKQQQALTDAHQQAIIALAHRVVASAANNAAAHHAAVNNAVVNNASVNNRGE